MVPSGPYQHFACCGTENLEILEKLEQEIFNSSVAERKIGKKLTRKKTRNGKSRSFRLPVSGLYALRAF